MFGRTRALVQVITKHAKDECLVQPGEFIRIGKCSATFSATDKDMVKKVSYFTLVFFIFGAGAFGVSTAGIHTAASNVASSLPESGSLAVLGSLLISGATLLRRRLSSNIK
jgi:hypothetical protein